MRALLLYYFYLNLLSASPETMAYPGCASGLRASAPVTKASFVERRGESQPVAGLTLEKTSLADDFLSVGDRIPASYRPAPVADLEGQMRALGWGNPMFTEGREDIARYIVNNKIYAPSSEFAYHGSSTAFHSSLVKYGLDNRKGVHLHAGGAMAEGAVVTYSGDAQFAQGFATSAG